ncbi:unnamed protein product [uncultured Mediterranean phage uvMED]|nr:unnamed protein product [uncultured Mediterranean phage uvMED]
MFDKKAHNREYYQRNKDRIKAKDQKWREANPKQWAFLMHRQHSKERGIDFLFNFDSWVEWWGDDYPQRGVEADSLCMARIGDRGPYSPENTVKQTNAENVSDSFGNKCHERPRI